MVTPPRRVALRPQTEKPPMTHPSHRALVATAAVLITTGQALGQTVQTLLPGDTIPDNTVIPDGSTVNVNGGTIGLGVDLSNGILNINGGSVALGATGIPTGFTNTNNVVNLAGGEVGGFFQLIDSELTITGGTIESFGLFGDTTVNIDGGTVTRFPDTFSGGTVNLRGGDVFATRVFAGATLNVFGTDFALDGVPLADLSLGQTQIIDTRNVTLSATLADGSFFDTDLNTAFGGFSSSNPDGAAAGATISVTLVPEPAALTLFVGAGSLLLRRRGQAHPLTSASRRTPAAP